MTKTELLEGLRGILEEDQINLDEEALYDAAADRYKKYAKAKKSAGCSDSDGNCLS